MKAIGVSMLVIIAAFAPISVFGLSLVALSIYELDRILTREIDRVLSMG